MTGNTIEVFARVRAYQEGRAVPIRSTSRLSADPVEVFAIAPIQLVAEQRLQAVAFGNPERAPQIITVPSPLDREADPLAPFAEALDRYMRRALADGFPPRIWLPHGVALNLVTLLGERYRTNQRASPIIQRLGWICYGLGVESQFDGQQTIAVASELLRTHIATGQSLTEDMHLAAQLVWINPPAGADVRGLAAERALRPAAAMLDRESDDRVEALRERARGNGREARAAQVEIERLLRSGAESEWNLLVEARRAFWSLGLPPAETLERLRVESRSRIESLMTNNYSPPSRPHSLARRLDGLEAAIELAEDADIRGDAIARERARRAGRVIAVDVIAVDQPRPGRRPCRLLLRTRQEVVRVRMGTKLQTIDATIEGVVVNIGTEPGTGARRIELDVRRGVRSVRFPRAGVRLDLTDTSVFGGGFMRKKIYEALAAAQPELVYGRQLPPSEPRRLPAGDLLEVAERLRRRGRRG